jgi:hypothetical protein
VALFAFMFYTLWKDKKTMEERNRDRLDYARILSEANNQTTKLAKDAFVQMSARSATDAAHASALGEKNTQMLEHNALVFNEQLEKMKHAEPPPPPKPRPIGIRRPGGERMMFQGNVPDELFKNVPEGMIIREGDPNAEA